MSNETAEKVTEVIFYGDDSLFTDPLGSYNLDSLIHVNRIDSDRNLLRQVFQKTDIGILLLYLDSPEEVHEVLTLKEAFQKDTQVILFYKSLTLDFLQEMQENFDLYRVINSAKIDELFVRTLLSARNFYQERRDNKNIFIKYHQKNKKWKELSSKLAATERDKQELLQRLKNDEQHKRLAERKLQRFITNLSYVSNMDDYIKSLFREIRKRVEILGLYIIVEHHTYGQVLYSLQRGKFIFQRLSDSVSDLSILDKSVMREFLANRLNRPLLSIEKKFLEFKNKRNGFMLFELEVGSDLDADFNHFWKQVDQATAMILDRLLLRLEMDNIRSIWEKTFESLTSPLVILDKDGKIVKMNKAFLQIQSYDLMLFLIDNHKSKVSSLEWKTQMQNFQLLAFPILFEHGAWDSTLYYFQDQNELQENYSKMVQTEKMAAIGLLAGNIAHELNNPFAGLKSITQLLLTESEFALHHDDLREILSGVDRCLSTIQNLQNYSGEDNDSRQILAIKDIIENTIPLLKSALRQYYVSIDYQSEPKANVNSHLLQQVIFNLVHNSSQAMSDGGKLIIKVTESSADAIISIQDDGKGIAEVDMPFVFDPFFTTKKIGDGTGLGLSICKKIIESFGGRIEVVSKVGIGSTFTIIIPKVLG